MNWASVAKAEPVKAQPAADTTAAGTRVAVLDANALITQHGLLNLALVDKCVTTPEVLREVRDKQARATLAALPFEIHTQEPSEESIKAGKCLRQRIGGSNAETQQGTRLWQGNSEPATAPQQAPLGECLSGNARLPALQCSNLRAPRVTSMRCPLPTCGSSR